MAKTAKMQTPLRLVRGLGSAKDGTAHFWRVRVTSVVLVPLSLFAIGLVVSLADASFAETRATLAQPLVALFLGLFVVVSLDHMRAGMEEIILDYIHGELGKVILLILNTCFTVIVGAASILALLKIVFGG